MLFQNESGILDKMAYLFRFIFLACFMHTLFVKGANLPTLTISKLATIRFPNDDETPTSTRRTSLLVSTEPLRPTTTTTIRPSPSENVHIVGNYSIAVQQVKTIKKENEVDEIIEKTSSLLELLDFWRKLPRERLAEIYPHVLGQQEGGSSQGTALTSSLELLNKLRQQQETTLTTSTTAKPSTTSSTTTSRTITISSKNVSSIYEENLDDDDLDENTTPVYDEADVVTSNDDASLIDNDEEAETDVPVFQKEEEQIQLFINDTIEENDIHRVTTFVQEVQESEEKVQSDVIPPLLAASNITQRPLEVEASPTTPLPTSTSYEFTDYPPPLPPNLSGYDSVRPPHLKRPQEEGPSLSHRSDASFALGLAVGILACVVVAAACVTWCICRKHWGRRNVYATMEAEEIPKAFTKPGPPIILPNELFSSQTKVMSKRELQHSTPVEAKTNVTEL